MSSWESLYKERTVSVDELFNNLIVDGVTCFCGGLHAPTLILKAMMDRAAEGKLSGVDIYANYVNGDDIAFGDWAHPADQFRYRAFFSGPNERSGHGKNVTHVPVNFSQVGALMHHVKPDLAIVQMTPPDKDGMCNCGPLGFAPEGICASKKIIAQINPNLPRVFGQKHNWHVSEIAAFVMGEEELEDIVVPEATADEKKVAELIVDRINDGDCVQLGIGGILNAIADGLYSKEHLGCYTEMFSDAFVPLQQKGIIDNSRKNYFPGVTVAGYSTGSKRLYDFIDNNMDVYYVTYDVVTNPYHIAKNDNLVSVNTAISIDLTGQVCAESIGPRQYSASGGQLDFVRGARMSKGGRSFIAVTSVANTKNGPVSKITPMLAPGSAVTTPRNEVQYIATEYGIADLAFVDIPTRVERLIKIAHPDFRDELTFEAKKMGILY